MIDPINEARIFCYSNVCMVKHHDICPQTRPNLCLHKDYQSNKPCSRSSHNVIQGYALYENGISLYVSLATIKTLGGVATINLSQ